MTQFNVIDKLPLPENAVTQTFGFFGRKGSGKTYAAGVLVESFLSHGVQVVILDPVGNWYALRLAKDGRSPSTFKIPILGGEHGDIPLEAAGGALVAQTIVETGTSAVLDISSFRKAERKRFMADFAEELFHRKKTNRLPMHLVIEEAQKFAPQMAKGEERMLGAIEDLVRLGRNYGIGCSMISQRPQSINTEVRNQCEPLVVFQLIAKHERDAIADWMENMGVDQELEELSTLHPGQCFFWSPAWLEKFVKTRFHGKFSFDGSSTPTAQSVRSAEKLKPLDLGKLQQAMAGVIEKAKADDPVALKKRIAELERLSKSPTQVDANQLKIAVAQAHAAGFNEAMGAHGKFIEMVSRYIDDLRNGNDKSSEILRSFKEALVTQRGLAKRAVIPNLSPTKRVSVDNDSYQTSMAVGAKKTSDQIKEHYRQRAYLRPLGARIPVELPSVLELPDEDVDLPVGERNILSALIQYPDGLTRKQITIITSYVKNTRNLYLQKLSGRGYVETWGERMRVTEAGRAALPNATPLPTGEELRDFWKQRLPLGEWRVLEYLISIYPKPASRQAITDATNYVKNTRNLYLQKLRGKELITGSSEICASENLF